VNLYHTLKKQRFDNIIKALLILSFICRAKSYIWSSTFKGEHPIFILKELCSSLSKIHMYNNEDISTKKNRSIRNR
jgi:hypothetical protein